LQCVAVHFSVLQCTSVCYSVLLPSASSGGGSRVQCSTVCCSVLQCVAVCCSVLQCVAVCCSALQCVAVCCYRVRHQAEAAVFSAVQCVAVCCSVLQCSTVCCSVLQCAVTECVIRRRQPHLKRTPKRFIKLLQFRVGTLVRMQRPHLMKYSHFACVFHIANPNISFTAILPVHFTLWNSNIKYQSNISFIAMFHESNARMQRVIKTSSNPFDSVSAHLSAYSDRI